ncbi:unnamed protein product [Ceutorhynchus assimilis]|uniref:Uncharacterized protein n=1 Tax=Ceutorhynchus assimilis TaxID=467358 RepID=A0A9P0DHC2_9CUCU|nr:unnamed protein product [Ceutorhynchus assimilis]
MIPDDVQLMIDKICRSCMCESAEMQNVFEKSIGFDAKESGDHDLLLRDMLMSCAAVEVSLGDGLPYLLCTVCESKLNTAYQFKQQCEKSDAALRALTNPQPPKDSKSSEEAMVIQPDVHQELFEIESDDDLPLSKRKRTISPSTLTCPYCLKVLSSKKNYKCHLRLHTQDGLRYCPVCPAKYSRTNHLMRHINNHDKTDGQYSCKLCNETFSLCGDLYRHMKVHLNKVEKKLEKSELDIKIEIIKDESTNAEKENIIEGEDEKLTLDELIAEKDTEDSMDIPLSQFPFSDNDDNFDDSISNEDEEEMALVVKQEKRPRGRPPSKKDSTLYECKHCRKILTTHAGLKLHLRKHTGIDLAQCKTRECEFCDRKFKYKKSYLHHMQIEHGMSDMESDTEKRPTEDTPIEELPTANKTDKTNQENGDIALENYQTNGETSVEDLLEKMEPGDDLDLSQLDENDTKPKLKVHTCHVCQAQFARANHLTRHMTLHRAVLTHKCDRCDQAFFTEGLLKEHIEQQHINKPYICTTCNKPFSRGEHLIRHLKLHQEVTDEGEHKCSICESVFQRSDHLARHTKTHLMQDKRHVCLDCGKAFNRLDNLKTHQRIHTGAKDNAKLHLCVYCGKEFNNSSNMIVHMRRHTGERPYKCNECGKGFPRSHDLKCHERTHSGEKPYLCTLCGKSFNKSNKLLRHSRVHTGERPYVCNICSRAFTQSNDLALHMRRHTGARPYACGVCPARFIQSGQLKNHRRQTGHWMETQPDLKGGHRVEPVTSAVEPMPIKFKSFGKTRGMVKIEQQQGEPLLLANQQPSILEQSLNSQQTHQLGELQQPQRILMGIMGNIKLQGENGEPLILDGNTNKIVELPGGQLGLVSLPTVIQNADGEQIKLKTEIGNFNLGQVDEDLDKHEVSTSSVSYQDTDGVVFSTVQTGTTYSSAENFNFQTFN